MIIIENNILVYFIGDNNKSLVFVATHEGIYTEYVFFSSVRLDNETNGCRNDKKLPVETEGQKEIFVESCGDHITIYVYE